MTTTIRTQAILGNGIDFMKSQPDKSFTAVITDPPYGIDLPYNGYKDTQDNLASIVPEFLKEAQRVAQVVAVFSGVTTIDLYKDAAWRFAWVRPAGTGRSSWSFNCWSPIHIYGEDTRPRAGAYPDIFIDYKGRRENWGHPYEKPLSVMTWLVERFTRAGDTVLDPFMGSATTLVAAYQLGRHSVGVEIAQESYEIAERRIKAVKQQPILLTTKEKPQKSPTLFEE